MHEKPNSEFCPVIAICREDLQEAYKDDPQALRIIEIMSDSDMENFASELQDALFDSCFWPIFKTVFEEKFLQR